jgi:hypothetical protein
MQAIRLEGTFQPLGDPLGVDEDHRAARFVQA